MTVEDRSEFAVEPRLVLVHQPTAFGGFDGLARTADAELLATTLFRSRPDPLRLLQQHDSLVKALEARVPVAYLADILGAAATRTHRALLSTCHNLLFTHDAMITLPWAPGAYIPASMRPVIRRPETRIYADVAAELGLRPLLQVPEGLFLEGGDVFPLAHDGARRLLVGYGPRTSARTPRFLREALVSDGIVDEVIGIEIAPWRLNLDGCCFPVDRHTVVVNRESLVSATRYLRDGELHVDPLTHLAALGFTPVEASREESFHLQACNFSCLGPRRLVAYGMTERINDQLRHRGLEVISVDGSELVKGNGGPHCLTRPIY